MTLRQILQALTPSNSTIDHAKMYLALGGLGAITDAAGKVLVSSEVTIAQSITTGVIFGGINGSHIAKGTFFHSNASNTQKMAVTFGEYLVSQGLTDILFSVMGADASLFKNLLGGAISFSTLALIDLLIEYNASQRLQENQSVRLRR